MTQLFAILNLSVLPIWILMILAPRAERTARVLASPFIVAAPIAAYAALVLPQLRAILPIVARPELNAVQQLLSTPLGATAAWAHFLAFDLWVARFVVLDAREGTLPSSVLSAILVLTLLLGPLGLAAYGLTRLEPLRHARRLLALSYQSSPSLTRLAMASGLTGAITFGLQAVDARRLAGASVWLKPTKFGVSIAIAMVTLALLLRVLVVPEKLRQRAIAGIVYGTGFELVVITLQAARGVASHFNFSTGFDGAIFIAMGLAISVVTAYVTVFAWCAFRNRYENMALGAGIRLGLSIMVFGSLIAYLMTLPTHAQLQPLLAGKPAYVMGTHAVGAVDEGRAMPMTSWNLAGGDLRVPHFLGLHALQVLPLCGLWLGRRRSLSPRLASHLTRVVGAAYLGLVITTLVQALRGRSLFAPDAVTIVVAVAIASLCALAAVAAWLFERRANDTSQLATMS